MKPAFFCLCLFLLSTRVYSQYAWEGKVLDSLTGKPLAFVTIILNQNNTEGTRTDIDGRFHLTLPASVGTLTLSYVGYKTRIVTLNGLPGKNTISLYLIPEDLQLGKVTIVAGENPANRIIRAVTKNADRNNPDKLHTYSYTSYEKASFTGQVADNFKLKDTAYAKEFEFFKNYKLFILETVVKKEYKYPGRKKETVIGVKASGFKNPSFTLLMSEIQSTSFYNPFISVVQKSFLNPVTKGSTDKYFFAIEDTTYSGRDTVFVISFKPARGKNFEGLKGLLYINTSTYALEEVIASPADTIANLLNFTIQQQYARVDGVHWFPVQLNTDLFYNNFMRQGLKMTMSDRSYISDIKIDSEIPNSHFDGIELEMNPKAGLQPASFWNENRHDSLTHLEQKSYSAIDRLGKKYKLDAKLRIIESLSNGELAINDFNIILTDLIKLDEYESVRLGMGLRTNNRLSPYFSVGGFAGYGLNDKVWKYGANTAFTLYKRNNVYLHFNYSRNYVESGIPSFYEQSSSGLNSRDYLVSDFDDVLEKEISLTARAFKYLNFEVSAFQKYSQARYNYAFAPEINDGLTSSNSFHYAAAEFALRYCYNEKVIQTLHQNWFVSSKYPVIWVNVTKGFKGIADGQFDYWKFDLMLSYSFKMKGLGQTSLELQSGHVIGNLPYSELYSGRGNYTLFGIYSPNSFQVMRLNEFLSSTYAALYILQDCNTLLFRTKKFQPKVLFATNAAIGTLNNLSEQLNVDIKTLDKCYLESGVIIDDILTFKYYGVARFGLGGGVFYRYGPYSLPNPWDNVSFKLDWSIEN